VRATLTFCLATDDKQLAKALVMRGHAKGKEVANVLIGLLSSTEEEGHKKYATVLISPTLPVTRACFLTVYSSLQAVGLGGAVHGRHHRRFRGRSQRPHQLTHSGTF
jgi:hypothetical protein